MQTMQHEESGARPSYEETGFGGDDITPLLSATDSNIEEALFNLKSGEGPGIRDILKRDKFTGAINQNKTPKSNPGVLPPEIMKDIDAKAKRFILSRFPNARLEYLVLVLKEVNHLNWLSRGQGGKQVIQSLLKTVATFSKVS